MEIIKRISEMITEEIEDAEKYARCALNNKESRPELAETFFKLSTEEMGHMAALHDQVTKIIMDYRRKSGEPPKEMLAVYNYLHEKQMESAAHVKAMQALYRG